MIDLVLFSQANRSRERFFAHNDSFALRLARNMYPSAAVSSLRTSCSRRHGRLCPPAAARLTANFTSNGRAIFSPNTPKYTYFW